MRAHRTLQLADVMKHGPSRIALMVMLDLKWIRENRESLQRMLTQRRSKLDIAPLFDLDTERRKVLTELETLQAERNKTAAEIGRIKAQKGDATELLTRVETSKA